MSEPHRTPRTPERAEGDPPGEEADGGRTPHAEDPAEGGDAGTDGADTPG